MTVKQFRDKFLRKPYVVNLMEELTLKGVTQVSHGLLTVMYKAMIGQWSLIEGYSFSWFNAVLRICGGETESALLEHPLLKGQ